MDYAGRVVYSDRYFSLAGVSLFDEYGAPADDAGNGNYYRTSFACDLRGRAYWTKNALGTIRQTDFDGLDRPVAEGHLPGRS